MDVVISKLKTIWKGRENIRTKARLVLLITVLLSSCDPPPIEPSCWATSPKLSLATEVRLKTLVQLRDEYKLIPYGIGGGMIDEIHCLALSFFYYKELDIEEGRKLLMTAAKVFLDNINKNEPIRKYLNHYPYRPRNIELRIFLKKPDGSECDPDALCIIKVVEGKIEYEIDHDRRLITIYEESFEEAAEKVGLSFSL